MPERLNLTEQQITNLRRSYLYTKLYDALKESAFELVIPIRQHWDPALGQSKGYCHGYGEVWTENFFQLERNVKPFDWQLMLDKDQDYPLDFMPITEEIKQRQRIQTYAPSNQRKDLRKAKAFLDHQAVVGEMLNIIFANGSNNNQVYIFDISTIPDMPKCNCMPNIFHHYPRLIKNWHEIRVYRDQNSYLHWFDVNIGWIKSINPNPGKTSCKKFFNQLFEIVKYTEYLAVSCSHHFQLEMSSSPAFLKLT